MLMRPGTMVHLNRCVFKKPNIIILIFISMATLFVIFDMNMIKTIGTEIRKEDQDTLLPNQKSFWITPLQKPKLIYKDGQIITEDRLYGTNGVPSLVDTDALSELDRKRYYEIINENGFNIHASDLVPVQRQLPNVPLLECDTVVYSSDLPATSIVIVFHDEAWSTLLRTVHSALNRSPPSLLMEILLIDDNSDLEHLKRPLDTYLDHYPKVKIIRSTERLGLIRARNLGVKAANSEVITFLDAHCECFPGWLEPLLQRIAENPKSVPCPRHVDINSNDFSLNVPEGNIYWTGTFDWELMFHWYPTPQRVLDHAKIKSTDPYPLVTMLGGQFSIHRDFFASLGYYDEGMHIWGCENTELSIKVGMCGGTLETVPCSVVGHLFRGYNAKTLQEHKIPAKTNCIRLAKVWMDDYQHIFLGLLKGDVFDYGDISERIQVRKNLGSECKSFDWYMKNVAVDVPVPKWIGTIENRAFPYCLDSQASYKVRTDKVTSWHCHTKDHHTTEGEFQEFQEFLYSQKNELRKRGAPVCLDFVAGQFKMVECHGKRGSQEWIITPGGTIRQGTKCISLTHEGNTMALQECIPEDHRFQWITPTHIPGFN